MPKDNDLTNGLPIHERIPREIFETILHLCVGFETPVKDLISLQLVCRSWRDVIADTSFLWGTITTEEGPQTFRKTLGMAKDSLLDITFIDDGEIEASEFFSLTGEKLDQWRSLSVESESMAGALAVIQAQKPPKLNRLHLDAGYVEPSSQREIVLFGGAPAIGLKDVRLTRVPISPAALRMSGLKSLHLDGIPSITAEELIALLIESPDLEILHLNSLQGGGRRSHPSPTQTFRPICPFTCLSSPNCT